MRKDSLFTRNYIMNPYPYSMGRRPGTISRWLAGGWLIGVFAVRQCFRPRPWARWSIWKCPRPCRFSCLVREGKLEPDGADGAGGKNLGRLVQREGGAGELGDLLRWRRGFDGGKRGELLREDGDAGIAAEDEQLVDCERRDDEIGVGRRAGKVVADLQDIGGHLVQLGLGQVEITGDGRTEIGGNARGERLEDGIGHAGIDRSNCQVICGERDAAVSFTSPNVAPGPLMGLLTVSVCRSAW